VVLLAAFAVIETRSPQPLLPLQLLRDRNRTGAYLSYAGMGIFIFGMFFFLTVVMQTVWGYSALKTGVAYLPFTAASSSQRARSPSLCPGLAPARCCWPALFSAPAACTGCRGSASTPPAPARCWARPWSSEPEPRCCSSRLSLVALNRVAEADSGVASSLLNTGQQVGGSIGLAVLGTVAWTAVARDAVHASAAAARAGHPVDPGGPLAAAIYRHAIATGFARGFLVAAGIALLTLAINITVIRVRRADLAGAEQPALAVVVEPE
jgi:hypothetical protein